MHINYMSEVSTEQMKCEIIWNSAQNQWLNWKSVLFSPILFFKPTPLNKLVSKVILNDKDYWL